MTETTHDLTAEIAASLRTPEAYPAHERPDSVLVRETHSAMVFLAGQYAYKLKKPVDFGFLDFTTLEKRRYYCYMELMLNLRAAPDIYLAVAAIVPNGTGGYRVEPDEFDPDAVDYLVQMARLPEDKMLDARLADGSVTPDMIRNLGHVIAEFHDEAETDGEITAIGGPDTVRFNVEENFSQTTPYIGRTITRETYDTISTYARRFMDARAALFHTRAAQGFIRNCHGDLHAAQICIEDNGRISVLDCIDFNDRFRYGDTASDVGFMTMDLEARGRPDLARVFLTGYLEQANDPGMPELLPFYACYRAYVRGKVESFRLDQPGISDREAQEIQARASAYFELAARYAGTGPGPFLVLVGGLMGTGKSTLALGLAQARGFAYLSTDVVRKELAGVPTDERHFDQWDSGLYTPEMTERTYGALTRRAEQFLAEGRSVVMDGSFSRAHDRARFRALSRQTGVPLLLALCELNEESVRERLTARVEAGGDPSDGRWEIFARQRDGFELPADLPAHSVMRLDTDAESAAVLDALLARLDEGRIQ